MTESAFGVEHGEVSKALKPAHLAALRGVAGQRGNKGGYALARIASHDAGATGKAMGRTQKLIASNIAGTKKARTAKQIKASNPKYEQGRLI